MLICKISDNSSNQAYYLCKRNQIIQRVMEYNKIIVNCRIEEVPLIGRIFITNLKRDKPLFFADMDDYTDEYIKTLEDQLVEIEGLIRPVTVTEVQKAVTARIKATLGEIRPHVNALARRIRRAKNLTLPLESFRLSDIREQISKKDIEGVIQCIKDSMVFVDQNIAALKLKGFKDEDRQYFDDVIAQLTADKVSQSEKGTERRVLSQDNIHTINAFVSEMMLVLKDGYDILEKNPALRKDYTFVHLRSLVRQQRKATGGHKRKETLGAVSGKVTDKATHLPKAGVLVRAMNTDFTTTTDANGEYMIDGLTKGKYVMQFKVTGCKDLYTENVTIKAGKDTELNVEMEGE